MSRTMPAEAASAAEGRPGWWRRPDCLATVVFVLVVTGWAVLWAGSNPPGAAPDEPSHYVKAVAAGSGDLTGKAVSLADIERLHAFSPAALRQVQHTYRSFTIPRRLRVPTHPPCTAFRRTISAACFATPVPTPPGALYSIAGSYPPWFYLPGGALARFGWSPQSGYLLARLGSALAGCALLAAGVWLLAGGAGAPAVVLGGVAVAITPTAVFLASEAGASGPEVLGAVASAAAFLRLSRPGDSPDPRVWWVAGAVIGLAAMTRPLAPVWIAFGLVVAVIRLGVRGTWRRARAGGRAVVAASGLAIAGLAASVVWSQVLGVRTAVLWDHLGHGLRVAWRVVPVIKSQVIAVFGWQDTYGPPALGRAWWDVGIVLVVIGAVAAPRWRDGAALVVAAAGVCVLYEGIAAAVFEQNGFGMQGRYILPALVMLPLLAAELVAGRLVGCGRRVGATGAALAGGLVAASGAGQLVGWWANSRRYAVSRSGPVWFLPTAQWSPPGGWGLAVGLALGLTALTILAGFLCAFSGPARTEPTGPPRSGGRPALEGDGR